ncbi:MAG: hypothetical protein K2G67_01390 [Muribaculaceae bacterium]|nr:hypothetical protein [Muribaculaceae bacterium]
MKKTIIIILVALFSSLFTQAFKKDFIVMKYILCQNEEEHEEQNIRTRLPQYTVPCSIDSTMGLNLMGEPSINILSYEIWEINGERISDFDDEDDFIATLLKFSGDYEVRFITAEFTYIGIIKL